MKHGFYSHLAWNNFKTNRKLYLPFFINSFCLVMMNYLCSYLASDPYIGSIPAGSNLQMLFSMGIAVLALFTVIFLFYTNSFLIKRRKTEFGLYNILGMEKRHISRVLARETLFTVCISLVLGLGFGILFSKLAQLAVLNILGGETTFAFTVSKVGITSTVILFLVSYFLVYLNSVRQIHLANPIELLHSRKYGERPPKSNWVLSILGLLILGYGYYLAQSVKTAIDAVGVFFIAVLLVIIGTYICFIAASVAILRIMQKSKSYYYKSNHFVSTSGLVYRMKKNGAGLATVCILSTMVLVMLSTVTCMYFGQEDSLKQMYPRDVSFTIWESTEDTAFKLQKLIDETCKQKEVQVTDPVLIPNYHFTANISAPGTVTATEESGYSASSIELYVLPIASLCLDSTQYGLEPNQAYISVSGNGMSQSKLLLPDGSQYSIKGSVPMDELAINIGNRTVRPTVFVILPDVDSVYNISKEVGQEDPTESLLDYNIGFNIDRTLSADELMDDLLQTISLKDGLEYSSMSYDNVQDARNAFAGMYGGLFVLGILLAIVFTMATVLIIYYKQMTEGYEDVERFSIMKKVGMTQTEIKRSINNQVLTVFFLPLVTAGIHLAFAFKMLTKLLLVFGWSNTGLFLKTILITYFIFAVLYCIVYAITSKSYYHIVSANDRIA